MKHGEKMKRLLAVMLAFALAWSGVSSSGLSLVEAAEPGEETPAENEAGNDTNTSKDEQGDDESSDDSQNDEDSDEKEQDAAQDSEEQGSKTQTPSEDAQSTDLEDENENSDESKDPEKTEEEETLGTSLLRLLTNSGDDTTHEHSYVYISNGDGTHTVTCKDEDCDYEETEACIDEDEDVICDLCGGELEKEEDSTNKGELIADFSFEDVENAGDDISSKDIVAKGNYSLVDSYGNAGKAIELNGSNQYLSLKNSDGSSVLTGLSEVSVAADVYFERTGTDWLFFAANDSSSRSESNLHYIGAFQNGTKLNVERFHNSRALSISTDLSTNGWAHVEIVHYEDGTKVYVNGELVSEKNTSDSLEDILGDSSIFNIGKANWGSGEYCKAKIDNFQIYSYALSDSEVSDLYNKYLDRKAGKVTETALSLNVGYVTEDINLPAEYKDHEITWTTSDEAVITSEGKITRGSQNKDATLTAHYNDGEKEVNKPFDIIVLKEGKDVVTYVSNSPATGQTGGMKLAKESGDGFEALHKNQPIMYTTKGNKAYSAPTIMRSADGEGFYMVAADGSAGQIITYTTDDLITYENETVISTGDVSGITKIDAVYDLTEKRYEFYLGTADGVYAIYSDEMEEFTEPERIDYTFDSVAGAPSDAKFASLIGLTTAEYEKVVETYTNPYNTSVSATPTDEITVPVGTTKKELKTILEQYLSEQSVTAKYSDGTENKYSLRFTEDSVANVNTKVAGDYTLTGVIGGSGNFTDAEDYLIAERADPYVVYNEDDGYYYFTASYPMEYSGDADGYDRIILRRAKTIAGLSDAEEVTIWDENESSSLGRFIWAPEMHKIGDSWYLIATAGLNTGSGTTFNIRPFMIKFDGDASKDNMLDTDLWGEPTLVKAYGSDNILNGMSLDMTYFESKGTSYLIWADETRNSQNPSGISDLFIATIDPENPTQLTSEAKLLTSPEYTWERVNIAVNEGPGVFHKNGKVYMTYSASATGSEYCVGLMYADEGADLLNVENWTKLPYPILTSADFDDEVSGPGHNSFTYDEYGNLVIVYHARITASHATHTGDSLYDPCRNAYVKTVFFDEQGLPVFNMSDDDFIAGGDTFKVTLKVDGESQKSEPFIEYDFDESFTSGVAADSSGNGNDATLVNGAKYVKDDNYGQVLYLDGATSFGGTNSYLKFPEGVFDDKEELTISFDVNQVTRSGNYFTFALGTDDTKYLFYKAMATAEKLAITTSSYNNEKTVAASSVYPNTARVWINIKIVVSDDKISLYRDGKLIGTNKTTGIKLSDLGDDLIGYLGKSFYSGDTYFRGYFDNVKLYDTAFTESEISTMYALEQEELSDKLSDAYYVANNYVIPDKDAITGNISLPSNV
ncbi:MAG: family 43 glycosylhydrolase, partial [Pseudobutyrivibrio sp.]|nr:family 43 glycosylhydrolase [Pseudobutyrivibrio sp.]